MRDADHSSKESHTYNSHSHNRKTHDTISPDTASTEKAASIYTLTVDKSWRSVSGLGCVGTELRYKHT